MYHVPSGMPHSDPSCPFLILPSFCESVESLLSLPSRASALASLPLLTASASPSHGSPFLTPPLFAGLFPKPRTHQHLRVSPHVCSWTSPRHLELGSSRDGAYRLPPNLHLPLCSPARPGHGPPATQSNEKNLGTLFSLIPSCARPTSSITRSRDFYFPCNPHARPCTPSRRAP